MLERNWVAVWSLAPLLLLGAVRCAASEDYGPLVLPPPGGLQPLPNWTSSDAPTETLPTPTVELAADPLAVDIVEEDAVAALPMWYQPAYWLGPDPYDAGIEFGLNGSEGNNNVMSLRAGGYFKRKTEIWKLNSSIQYNKNHTNGIETQNNGIFDSRLERILDESPWSLFFSENLIYDEFQAFDVQLSLNTGVGYQWFDTETLDLSSRFGAGATREIGGVENHWEPQALFGMDYEHKLTKMQKLVAKVDYYPAWHDYRDYRVVTDIGWQIDLDHPENVSLKFSLVDRYDSTPDGVKPNNFDYAVLMIWKL